MYVAITYGPIHNDAIYVPGVKVGHVLGVDNPHRLTRGKPCHLKGKTCRKLQTDKIYFILKKHNTRASSFPALGLCKIIFKDC